MVLRFAFCLDRSGLDYKEIIKLCKLAEELGFDALCLRNKQPSNTGDKSLESWSLLPGISQNTRRIALIPLISDSSIHPGVLAKMAASVDVLSNGRLTLGIDGSNEHYPGASELLEMEKLEEMIQVILKLWEERDPIYFEGKYYQLRNAECLPKPLQRPHPKLLVLAKDARSNFLSLAARYADICVITTVSTKKYGECVDVLRENCQRIGRNYASLDKSIHFSFSMPPKEYTSQMQYLHAEFSSSSETSAEILEKILQFQKMGVKLLLVGFPVGEQSEQLAFFARRMIPPAQA